MYAALPFVAAKYGGAGKWSLVTISCLIWPLGASFAYPASLTGQVSC